MTPVLTNCCFDISFYNENGGNKIKHYKVYDRFHDMVLQLIDSQSTITDYPIRNCSVKQEVIINNMENQGIINNNCNMNTIIQIVTVKAYTPIKHTNKSVIVITVLIQIKLL